MRVPLSILIPTFNEELNLDDCLASVCGWADNVVVLDSFSSDRTLEIAKRFGVSVVQHAYEGPAQQKNWALDNLDLASEWVLFLDADERVPRDLQLEIDAIIAAQGNGYAGFYLNRRFIFYGRWIKHSGWYPSWNLRLFKYRLGRYEQRQVHEHIVLNGRKGYCRHDLIHEDMRDMTDWIAKHNRYATLEAEENFRSLQGRGDTGFSPSFSKGPVERKRALKDRLLIRLPAPLRSLFLFFYMYFLRLGFLDGIHGFHFCAMHATFEYYCGIKLWELKHYKQGATKGGISARKVFQVPPEAVRQDQKD
jgi:glycosyltransferase involved in cell wall biosynthesis